MKSKRSPHALCDTCTLNKEPYVPPFGDGSDYIAVVGEAPGADEVARSPRKPFVGRAGILLRRTLTKIGIEVERVHYTNAVMCRPPKNRDPSPTEIECCRPRLLHELSKVKPKVIVPLGGFGHMAVTGKGIGAKNKGKITKARGKPDYVDILGSPFMSISTMHPSAVLRSADYFPDLCDDLFTALGLVNGEPAIIPPPVDNYVLITDEKGVNMLMERLDGLMIEPDIIIALDLETDGLRFLGKDIVTCALSWKNETAVAFSWDLVREYPKFLEKLKEVLAIVPCSLHNGMFDIPWLNQEGIYPNYYWDTMLSSYCLCERKGVHGLERLSISHYKAPAYKLGDDIKDPKSIHLPKLLAYNATDADYTRRLTSDLTSEMDDLDLDVMSHLLMPAARHFTEQFKSGMLIDQDQLEANGDEWLKDIKKVEEDLRSHNGAEDLNPNSPRQVAKYIYDYLGLRMMGGGKIETVDQATLLQEIGEIEDPEAQDYWHTQSVATTKNMSARSTNTYMLFWLAQQHEWPRIMIRHRLLSKKWGTYYKGLRESMWPDGRMRPSVRLHGTVTGRQSSNDPNLHGTPRDPQIKDTYISDEGTSLIYGDYPQAEVRMLAHFAGDDNLIRALFEEDIHAAVARQLYGLTQAQWDALSDLDREIKRRAAKTIVFGVIYGRGAKGLAPQLGVTVEEAQYLIDRLMSIMPLAKAWIQHTKMEVITSHEVQSLYHRKRRFALIADKRQRSEVQRQAVNMPIQSSVSDMTFRAYYNTCIEVESMGIKLLRWAQIHDAFMIQVDDRDVKRAAPVMKDIMENHLDFKTEVPFGPVDIKVGKSWGQLEKISLN